MFSLLFLQVLVIGGLMLCGIGVAALIVLLVFDSRDKRIW